MQASARNQLSGKVTNVVVGAVTTEVTVGLKGGQSIVASLTRASADQMAIEVSKDVLALVKAPQVMIVKDFGGYRLSARNQLAGTVDHVVRGAVNTEVVIGLGGGDAIAATITNESADALALRAGDKATAVFKAGAVILASKG